MATPCACTLCAPCCVYVGCVHVYLGCVHVYLGAWTYTGVKEGLGLCKGL